MLLEFWSWNFKAIAIKRNHQFQTVVLRFKHNFEFNKECAYFRFASRGSGIFIGVFAKFSLKSYTLRNAQVFQNLAILTILILPQTTTQWYLLCPRTLLFLESDASCSAYFPRKWPLSDVRHNYNGSLVSHFI